MLPIEQLEKLIQGKKVAFIGAGVSHKRCIEQFVELGAQRKTERRGRAGP